MSPLRFRFVPSIVLAATLALAAQTTAALAEGWATTCEAGGRCTALLTMSVETDRKLQVRIGIQTGPNGSEPVMITLLPLGVALEPGVRAVIDGKEFKSGYQVCFPDGCRTVGAMTADDLEVWLNAPTASLQFFPFASDKPVAVDVLLAGLREALKL